MDDTKDTKKKTEQNEQPTTGTGSSNEDEPTTQRW